MKTRDETIRCCGASRRFFFGACLFILACPFAAKADDWKFDILRLKNGRVFQGLVLEETAEKIRFQCVRRHGGSPTLVISTTFDRAEVAKVEKLGAKDRAVLASRVAALEMGGKDEKRWMESLELKSAPWIREGQDEALSYSSIHFTLLSNAREAMVRRAAVRLEQIYAAYGRFLPPRGTGEGGRQGTRPTKIILVRSSAEYQAILKDHNRNIRNPAFYDPGRNQILCATDLERLGDDLERVRKKHQEALAKLKEQEADLQKQYKNKVPAALKKEIETARQEITVVNGRNEEKFQKATKQLFQTLYHEAFHAYLDNFVYPATEAEAPRWLNEGLAQVFETAILEAGELRVGHADEERLTQMKSQLRKGTAIGLEDLLRSAPKDFLTVHAGDQQIADRMYLNSWALAHYLTFQRRLLGTEKMDRYVLALKRGVEPVQAFQALVGQPVTQFEKEFQRDFLSLQPDGSMSTPPSLKR